VKLTFENRLPKRLRSFCWLSRRWLSRALAAFTAAAALTLVPALSFAQEFVKVEGKAGEDVPAGPFVAIAYGFIWIALLAYVVFVARGVARVRGEVDELRRKLDAAGKR
jgi:CcmD family protein